MHNSFVSLAFLAALLGGCTSMPPLPNRSGIDPSNPSAPETTVRRFRPNLVATTRVYLDPSAGQGAEKMDMSNMQGMGGMEGMDHPQMKGMDHSKMPGMGASQPAAAPPNKEALDMEMKKTSDEMKKLSDEMKAKSDAAEDKAPAAGKSPAAFYTCPMHPEIKEANPGNCPTCGMTLVKKSAAPEGAKP